MSAMPEPITALAPAETQAELAALEAIVKRGQQAFIEVGLALGAISDQALFTVKGYPTFTAYLAGEWPDITDRRAYYKIAEARTANEVNRGSGGEVLIDSGRAARAIAAAGLATTEERVDLAKAAAALHPDGKVTGPNVEAVIAERQAPDEDLTPEEEDEAARAASVLSILRPKAAPPAALTSQGSQKWFTPDRYMGSVHRVLGFIDLDPASCEEANAVVRANSFYDERVDGLSQDWRARTLWLNCPYEDTAAWLAKLLDHHRAGHVAEAIALVNANTSATWFKQLWDFPICLTDHRIRFIPGEGQPASAPAHGNAFVYLGPRIEAFAREFAQHGAVVVRFKEEF